MEARASEEEEEGGGGTHSGEKLAENLASLSMLWQL
jgi:hypothetical protein